MEILRAVSTILMVAGRVRRRRIARIAVVCGIVSVAGGMGCTGEVPPGYNVSDGFVASLNSLSQEWSLDT